LNTKPDTVQRIRYRKPNKNIGYKEVSEFQLYREVMKGWDYFWEKRPNLERPKC